MIEERNKSYRIKTNVNSDKDAFLDVNLLQDYDTFNILSLTISQEDAYRLHNANYGVVVGRVIANNGFGVPNAKISVFVSADTENDSYELASLYGYSSPLSVNGDGIRYNLLPDRKINDCHKPVGTFPTKTYLLDNDVLMEVFDKYYTLTTRTNESGDYMLCGVPTGYNTIHMDIDLSDCGILSQRPRDMVYKGYDINQFESANEFKTGTTLDSLKQILSQNESVYVNPFWGNDTLGETLGITRCDINVNYLFEPTCVFIGSVISDNQSNGISKKCVPTQNMGAMDELITGEGRIEMIRKTLGGDVESFAIKGTQLIDGDGTWCYQIPMNLDYVMTDEYGNMVPTDDPSKGIPTRTSVRFRVSLNDFDGNKDNYFRGKILVPHNPQTISVSQLGENGVQVTDHEDYDYEFGTNTKEESFRDLLWNNVYTVKQYIPRINKSKRIPNDKRFTGIKHSNIYGNNNPMPYNNIRIRLPLMFTLLCALIKAYIFIVSIINVVISWLTTFLTRISKVLATQTGKKAGAAALKMRLISIADGLCPDLDNWYFTPCKEGNVYGEVFNSDIIAEKTLIMLNKTDDANISGQTKEDIFITMCNNLGESGQTILNKYYALKRERTEMIIKVSVSLGLDIAADIRLGIINKEIKELFNEVLGSDSSYVSNGLDYSIEVNGERAVNLWKQTLWYLTNGEEPTKDRKSIDTTNKDEETEAYCLTRNTDYLISCIEMNLAMEYKVINFDFYNDWINGVLYFPRWKMEYRPKKSYFFGQMVIPAKTKGCLSDGNVFNRTRYYAQQCSLQYSKEDKNGMFVTINSNNGCSKNNDKQKCHNKPGFHKRAIFRKNGGLIKKQKTMLNEDVYYYKPCEWDYISGYVGPKVNLFATDVVLLGSLNDCSLYGVPQAFKYLTASTFKMPTNLALTNMDSDHSAYAQSDGTFCMGSFEFKDENGNTLTAQHGIAEDEASKAPGLREMDNTFRAENVYYSTLSGSEEFVEFKPQTSVGVDGTTVIDDDPQDPYPITEAAGIAWNYTGPGQGEPDDSKMYNPGGHFLGLSCAASQTNIKSCVNLKRICEVGAEMSQRREVIRGYTVVSGETILTSNKFIPTGIISNLDIVGPSFRSMFASMNMKRLKVDSEDEKTQYKKYSFMYLNPNGFGGEFTNLFGRDILETGSSYNKRMPGLDMKGDADMLEEANFSIFDLDFDTSTSASTYAHTNDVLNQYYYMFRFGLTSIKTKQDKLLAQSKFYLQDGETNGVQYMSLPQYENSFYFYFGLRPGATAFDKFQSEFFSECDTDYENSGEEPYMVITKNGLDKASGNSYTVSVFNMNSPFTFKSESQTYSNSLSTTASTIMFTGLTYGTYITTVVDTNGILLSGTTTFSLPDVFVSFTTKDLNYEVPSTTGTLRDLAERIIQLSRHNMCGYVNIDRYVEINGVNYDVKATGNDSCNIVIVDKSNGYYTFINDNYDVNYFTSSDVCPIATTRISGNVDLIEDSVIIYTPFADKEYSIYIGYKDGVSETYLEYDTFKIHGVANIDLYLGCKFLSYNNGNSERGLSLNSLTTMYDDNWWSKDTLQRLYHQGGYEKSLWLIRHFLTNQSLDQFTTFDANIFPIDKHGNVTNGSILFGRPENNNRLYNSNESIVGNNVFNKLEANKFYGYYLSDSNVQHETHTYNDAAGTLIETRDVFGKMCISDGIVAGNKITGITFTSASYNDGIVTLEFSGDVDNRVIRINHGCIIKYNNKFYYPMRSGVNELKYSSKIVPDDLSGIELYPIFYFPVFKKPFKASLCYLQWNDKDNGANNIYTTAVVGNILNGITDENNRFGESYFFNKNISDKVYKPLVLKNDIDSLYDKERITQFGYDSTNLNTILSYYANNSAFTFSVSEGIVSGIKNDVEANTPETISTVVLSGDTKAVFAFKMTTNRVFDGNGGYTVTANGDMYDNGVGEYYVICRSELVRDVNYPFTFDVNLNKNVFTYNKTCSEEYYTNLIKLNADNVITIDNKPYTFETYPLCIIGYYNEIINGNSVKMFKFYKL